MLRVIFVIALLLSELGGLLVGAPAHAISGQGLEISPPLLELEADPGQTVTANLKVRNVTNIDVVTSGTADDFGAADESGDPKLLLSESEAGPYSLKFWVPDVPNLRLSPQEIKTAAIQINVPSNAEPGGHYGVIRFTAQPADLSANASGVSLSASLGALILLKVHGNIKESVAVADFYASQHDTKHSFFESGPLNFVERLRNNGSVHEKPTGAIDIYDWLGHKVTTINVNDNPPHNILPASIRKFQQSWDQKALFGRYTAKLHLTYAGNKTLASTLVFWVIPWRLILVLILVALIIFFGGGWAIRRYNRMILDRSRRP